jgi:hypothetical protein
MGDIKCSECGQVATAANAYELHGRLYCANCAKSAIEYAKSSGQAVQISRYVDKSICSRCNTYVGESGAHLQVGNLRFCQPCAMLVQDWPYPKWLKLSLVGLLLLLGIALIHGKKYFEAGKNLYRGEQLVEQHQYAKSLPYLKQTLKTAPGSDKGALLAAKAALLTGDVQTAEDALQGHNGGHFEDGNDSEFREVKALEDRVAKAFTNLQKAQKIAAEPGNDPEVARLTHEAALNYPELPQMQLLVDAADQGVAFVSKDYDRFLQLAEKDWDTWRTPRTAATLSSALACKYATTGDPAFRQRSEELLAKAKELAGDDKDAAAGFQEYSERIRYRLESRQIIDKWEYDKKFRQGKTVAK